jgi:hypothetical protein
MFVFFLIDYTVCNVVATFCSCCVTVASVVRLTVDLCVQWIAPEKRLRGKGCHKATAVAMEGVGAHPWSWESPAHLQDPYQSSQNGSVFGQVCVLPGATPSLLYNALFADGAVLVWFACDSSITRCLLPTVPQVRS